MKFTILFIVLATSFAQLSATYVYEGKRLFKSVYHRQQPTILYASAGFGFPQNNAAPNPSISRLQVFPPSELSRANAPKSALHIPPSFVRGARLHKFDSLFTDRILTKPKRWAISTVYDPSAIDSRKEVESSTTTISSTTINPTTVVTPTEVSEPVNLDPVQSELKTAPNSNPVSASSYIRDPRASEQAKLNTIQLNGNDPTFHEDRDLLEDPLPEYRIRQNYLPAVENANRYSQFEMEGYQPVREQELLDPMRPVQHSPAPWAYRDVQRMGPPRHPACSQPLNLGVGPDEVSSWYYDGQLNVCRWFGYRGHGGNANRFYSRTACESLCIRDIENLCETVKCSWPGTYCSLVGDQSCKDTEEMYGREWQARCPPDQPVCLSRRGTRIAPDIDFKNIPQECYQMKDPGTCERKNPSVMFHYDRERNDCMTFYFHNCGGNDNRFETKSDCMSHCSP